MVITESEELTIFHLDDIEFEDAIKKNECLMQTQTPYAAYVLNGAVADNELLTAIADKTDRMSREAGNGDPVVYVSQNVPEKGTGEETVDFAGMLHLVSASVVGFLFPKKWVKRAGTFNAGLSAKTNFEFLCRMVRETGSCRVRKAAYEAESDAAGESRILKDDLAETLAYMIRYHMSELHMKGLMDQVFSFFCTYAQTEDFFPAFQRKVNQFLSDEKLYERLAMQTAPFVILRGDDTCGGVLQGFADDLADALADSGQAVIMVDEDFTKHEMLQNMVCKGVVGFQNRALEIDFFRGIHGPKFQFWFDNPLRFEGVLRNLPEEYFILCQDANYAALIRDYYHTPNAIQFPPGGKTPDGKLSCEDIVRHTERPYDIVFMGNYFADDAGRLTGFEREFYDYMLLHPCETFEQGLSELRGDLDADRFVTLSCSLKPACRAVIGHFRNVVVSTILEAGFTLHVYGESWRDYRGAGRERLKIHPYAAVEESRRELGKAKIGLNIMSWHKAGMTERIANIMLSGAVCLTEETVYLREHMQEGGEIVTFRLDRLEELPDKLNNLLDDADRREKVAVNAYRRAAAEYTWKCRAEELIALSRRAAQDAQAVSAAAHAEGNPPQKAKRLVLFRSELDTLNLFSEQLKQGFLELGYEIFDFDLMQSAESLGLLSPYLQEGSVAAMIGFNSAFFGMTLPSGENMWEVLGIPCVNILVDHPYWYHNILMRMPSTGIVLCIDRNHMDYVNRFYPNIPSNGFLAHGGVSFSSAHKPISERKTEVLYAGSFYAGFAQRPDLSGWDFPAYQVCDNCIAHLLAHPEETIEGALERQLLSAGIALSEEELRRFISSCVYIERVVSSHYREQAVGSVARAGISLELYGDGWEKCDWIGLPNVHYGGRVAPEEILQMMEDSRIVLNTLPWFRDGSHERVFNAMLCGAVAVSETSQYLEETLPAGTWEPFDLSEEGLSALPGRIIDLLSDEEKMQEIASAGQQLAASAHTWKDRAKELHQDLISYL